MTLTVTFLQDVLLPFNMTRADVPMTVRPRSWRKSLPFVAVCLPFVMMIIISGASSADAAPAARESMGRLEMKPPTTPHGTFGLLLMEMLLALALRQWRRGRRSSYVVLLPDLMSAEGLIVGIGQVAMHFPVDLPFQAISDDCMDLKRYPADAWWMHLPAMTLASARMGHCPRPAALGPLGICKLPMTFLESPLERRAPPLLTASPVGEEWVKTLRCMSSRSRGGGTLALTSAAATAGCAWTPGELRVTWRLRVAAQLTLHMMRGILCWDVWGLRDAGCGARQWLLKWGPSGWGTASWFRRSAWRWIETVVVK
jgi:hypothetical protein